jgi:chromosome segregation ATPase
MLRNILRLVTRSSISSAKKSTNLPISRNLSTDAESWVKIYKEMQGEAGKIAETSVGNVRSEISSVRSEMNSIKSDINSVRSEFKSEISSVRSEITIVKSDIAALKTDVASVKADVAAVKTDLSNFKSDTYRQFSEVHKQASNNVRTILAGMFGVGSATVAVNQYLSIKKDESISQLTPRKL